MFARQNGGAALKELTMRKIFKVLAIIALAAVIGFSFACSGGDGGPGGGTGGGGGTPTPVAPAITTAALPDGAMGTAYSQTLTATGDTPITWSVESGTLPNGLTLSAEGVISGTTTTSGASTFTVKAANGTGSDTKSLSITVRLVEMVSITAGTFTMGSPTSEAERDTDETQHSVTLTGFSIGKYQVTQEQYQAVMGAGEDRTTTTYGRGDNYPIYFVSWYDALAFCNRLSIAEGLTPVYSISGKTDPSEWGNVPTSNDSTWDAVVMDKSKNGYRLPTEAEWEYACRAGTTTAYNTGDTLSDNTGWYITNSGIKTHQVGLKTANAWGLYDMHGNVYEWCWDWYDSSYYSSSPANNPTGAATGSKRVIRGGSCGREGDRMRSAFRGTSYPSDRFQSLGFRLVR